MKEMNFSIRIDFLKITWTDDLTIKKIWSAKINF